MSPATSRHHTSTRFDAELEDVRQRVMAMGGLVEAQLLEAVAALTEGDADRSRAVETSDEQVNRLEIVIDDECARILARRQPTAGDLRMVYTVIKTVTDLERIGDEAQRIARMARDLQAQGHSVRGMAAIGHLARQVLRMVHGALDAFARMDAEAAIEVVRDDEAIDREHEALLRQCITFMMEDPRTVGQVLDLSWSVRSLERVGDHAKSIAKYVVYLVKGKDVRHMSIESMEREVRER